MANPNLTVLVLNLSPSVTLGDLNAFFSYCGHVEKIQLLGVENRDRSQSALVTYRQPYAYQTALLLNNAIFAGQQIRVLPKKDGGAGADPPISHRIIPIMSDSEDNKMRQGNIWVEKLNQTRDELEHKFKLSEKSRVVMDKTRLAVCAADLAISTAGEAAKDVAKRIKNTDYAAVGATWLSSVLQQTSKLVLQLSNRKGYNNNNPNSRDH